MTDLGGIYDTGTATFTNGSTTVVFSGTVMTTQAVQGDHLMSSGLLGMVDVVTDDTHLELRHPWSGATAADVEYVLNKVAASRYDPALTQAKAREFLSFFEGIGTFYFVEGSEPDVGLGQNGQFALKVNSGAWKIWYKIAGIWELQGSPVGVNLRGTWNSGTAYIQGDWVSFQGKLYSALQPSTGQSPDVSPTYWRLEISGGDRYDCWSYDTDRPASGEQILKGFPKGVTFYAGLADSYARADVAATASSVFSVKKNGVEFATVTFGAGNVGGTFSCPTQTAFGTGDILTIDAPNPRDTTLSGVAINIIGYR